MKLGDEEGPPTELPSEEEFLAGYRRRFGQANPERMEIPFWTRMVRSRWGAWGMAAKFGLESIERDPVWCFTRLGTTHTLLLDRWLVSIGGEHEDWYDPDFMIYNDVIVRDFHGGVHIFGYPKDVFLPTDFHSATLVGELDFNPDFLDVSIYIIGGLGYKEDREWWRTPVYELDLHTMRIKPLEFRNEEPGWIFNHEAALIEPHLIRVKGGEKINEQGEVVPNDRVFDLDLLNRCWHSVNV